MTLVSLGTHIADDRKRLAHVMAATHAMKATLSKLKNVLPTDFPSLGVSWLTGAASALYKRATQSDLLPPVANVAISNVPGPPVPLYLAGAKMLTNYPCSIITHGMALNITVQSYDQSLDFGMMADAKAMPDVRKLALRLTQALERLRALPVAAAAEAVAPLAAKAAVPPAAKKAAAKRATKPAPPEKAVKARARKVAVAVAAP